MQEDQTPFVGGPQFADQRPGLTKRAWVWFGAAVGVIVIAVVTLVLLHHHTKPVQNAEKPLTVSLQNIKADQAIEDTTTVAVNVSEPHRVARVEYDVDGVFAGVTYAQPFSFIFKPANFKTGSHTIMAVVFDKDGHTYKSAQIHFTLKEKQQTDNASSTPAATTPNPVTTPKKASTGSATGTSGSTQGTASSGNTQPPANTGDTAAPTAPAGLTLAANDGYTVHVTWNSSSDNTGVTGYQILRGGQVLGASTTTSYDDQTVVPGNTYDYAVKALDAAGNAAVSTTQPSITLVPTSLWVNADSPGAMANDGSPIELGVRFKPLASGTVSGVRFYKASGDTATHTGSLWASDGTHLASVVFSDETASGWQTATFNTPVAVTANTTYVVSFTTPNGQYGYTTHYFDTAGITSQYLAAPGMADGTDNGVYNTTPGAFPSSSFTHTNYWVDAVFIPNTGAGGPAVTQTDNSVVYTGFPGSNNTGVPAGKRLPSRSRGITITADNTILDSMRVNGEVDIRAQNVTIQNSEINSIIYLDRDDVNAANWYVNIVDSKVNAGEVQRAVISLGQFTIRRSNIVGGQSGALCSSNCQVYDSWIHGELVPADQSWHLGGFLSNGGSDMTISHNTISCDTPNNTQGGGCSGDMNLYGDFAPIERITVDGNLFTANQDAGYCTAFGYNAFKSYGPGANHLTVTNNTFQRGANNLCGGYGPDTDYKVSGSPAPNSTWSNNRWDDGTILNPS